MRSEEFFIHKSYDHVIEELATTVFYDMSDFFKDGKDIKQEELDVKAATNFRHNLRQARRARDLAFQILKEELE